ncbi:MAG: hypothetical protein ACK551_00180 [Vampirovibrionales bacterium]
MMSLPAESALLESPSEALEQNETPTKGKRPRAQTASKSGVSRPEIPSSVEKQVERTTPVVKTQDSTKRASKAFEVPTQAVESMAVLVEEIPVQDVTLVESADPSFAEVATPPSSNPYLRPIHLLNAGLTFAPYEKEWQLSPEERELVSSSISQTWTDQAMKCYMCAADCESCDIPKGQYSFVCQMNKVVPVLLENIGQPDPHRLKRIFPQGYPHTAY